MRDNSPLVSIVMNCYNGEQFLREAIDSIYAQSYTNWEIIFWDNGSSDDSAKIAKSYDARLKYFFASNTTPLGEARNLALKKVSGEYIAFLDCDDRYLPDKLFMQVEKMKSGQYAMCYGGVIVINESGHEIRRDNILDMEGKFFDQLLLRYNINMQTVMIRRSILLGADLSFHPTLKFSPDYDLFMRIAIDNAICSVSNYLVEYRKVKDSLTTKLVDRIPVEMEYTLSELYKINSSSDEAIENGFKVAFQMLYFYKSLPFLKSGEYSEARELILKSVRVRKIYLIYYMATFIPIVRSFLLKVIMK